MQNTEFQFLVVVTSPAVLWALKHDRSSFAASNPLLMRLVQLFWLGLVFICSMQLLVKFGLIPTSTISASEQVLPTIFVPLSLVFLVLYVKARVMRAISWVGLLWATVRKK